MAAKWKKQKQDKGVPSPLQGLTRKQARKGPHFARYSFLKTAAETVSEKSTELAAHLGAEATKCILDFGLDIEKKELASQCRRCGIPLKPCNCSSVQAVIRGEGKPGGGNPGVLRICKVCEEENWTRCATMKSAEQLAEAEESEVRKNREMSTLLFMQSQEGQPQGSPGNIGAVNFDALPVRRASQAKETRSPQAKEAKKESVSQCDAELIDLTSSPEHPSGDPEEGDARALASPKAKRESGPSLTVGPADAADGLPPAASPNGTPGKCDIPVSGEGGSGARGSAGGSCAALGGGASVGGGVAFGESSYNDDIDDEEQSLDCFFTSPLGSQEEFTSRRRPAESGVEESRMEVDQSEPQQSPLPRTGGEHQQSVGKETQGGPSPEPSPSPTNNSPAPDIIFFPNKSKALDPTDCVIASKPADVVGLGLGGSSPVRKTSDAVDRIQLQAGDIVVGSGGGVGGVPPAGEQAMGQEDEGRKTAGGASSDGDTSENDNSDSAVPKRFNGLSLPREVTPSDSDGRSGEGEKDVADAALAVEPSSNTVEIDESKVTGGCITNHEDYVLKAKNATTNANEVDIIEDGNALGGSQRQGNNGVATAEGTQEGAASDGDHPPNMPPSENVLEGSVAAKGDHQPAPERSPLAPPSENAAAKGTIEEGEVLSAATTVENALEGDEGDVDDSKPQNGAEKEVVDPTPCDGENPPQAAETDETGQVGANPAVDMERPLESSAAPPTDVDEEMEADGETETGAMEVNAELVEGSAGDGMDVDAIGEENEEVGDTVDVIGKGNEEVADSPDAPDEEQEVNGGMDVDKEDAVVINQEDRELDNGVDGGSQQPGVPATSEVVPDQGDLKARPSSKTLTPTEGGNQQGSPLISIPEGADVIKRPVAVTQTDPATSPMEFFIRPKPEMRSVSCQNLIPLSNMGVQTKRMKVCNMKVQTQVKQRSKTTQATPTKVDVVDSAVQCHFKVKCDDIGIQAEIRSPLKVQTVCEMGIQCVLLGNDGSKGEAGTLSEKKRTAKSRKRKKQRKHTEPETAPQSSKRCKTGDKEESQNKAQGSAKQPTPSEEQLLSEAGSGTRAQTEGYSGAAEKKRGKKKKAKRGQENSQAAPKPSSSTVNVPVVLAPAEGVLPPKKKVSWRLDETSKGKAESQPKGNKSEAIHQSSTDNPTSNKEDAKPSDSGGEAETNAQKRRKRKIKKQSTAGEGFSEQAGSSAKAEAASKEKAEGMENSVDESRKIPKRKRAAVATEACIDAPKTLMSGKKRKPSRLMQEFVARSHGGFMAVLKLNARRNKRQRLMGRLQGLFL